MVYKICVVTAFVISLVSCQFSETMVLNQDGSGRMSLTMDMSEMMAMMPANDTLHMKVDSLISFKEIFEANKDSIASLSKEAQEHLQLLSAYQMRILMDPEKQKMEYEIFTDFKSVSEANNLMEGLQATENMNVSTLSTRSEEEVTKEPKGQPTGVRYTYKDPLFIRDAYIKDPQAFAKMTDSLLAMESFMEEAMYTIKYTFPKRIKSVSIPDASVSANGKSVTFQIPFFTYLKNPDTLDIQIMLEEN